MRSIWKWWGQVTAGLALTLAVASATACATGRDDPSAPGTSPNEILWDTWGVPHIFAASEAEAARAFGWAQMESHGDLLLRLYGEARGRAAEYWGEAHLEDDRWVRTAGIPGRAREWYEAQSPRFREHLDAFAAGINAWAEEHPDGVGEDVAVVLPVDAVDVLAHSIRGVHFTFVAGREVQRAERESRTEAGSNAWAIAPSRSESGHAMLLQNPHLPWQGLFLFYEAQIVAPGMDAYGVSLVGSPVLGIAFNDHLGWSHTVNTIDAADVYSLVREGDGYRFDGEVRSFETRVESLRVKQADGSHREEELRVRRSVHGPVVRDDGDRLLALRVAGLDAPGMLEQWWDMSRARSLDEFEGVLRRLQIPMFNVVYADREGHILYLFGGRVPKRSRGDFAYWQGVVPGDSSETLWSDVHDYDDLPRLVDPASGWLQNANDPPWTAGAPGPAPEEYPPYMAPRFMHPRAQQSTQLLVEDTSISFEELLEDKHSTRLRLADRVLDDLLAAARAAAGDTRLAAARVLEAWDRRADADSRGAVLFQEWAVEWARAGGGPAVAWSADAPLETPSGLADPAAAVAALDRAARSVVDAHGALDVAWGDVHRIRYGDHDLPANGAPGDPGGVFRVASFQPGTDGVPVLVAGDSYYAAIEFSDPVRARVLTAYGNATRAGSPHRGDQLELFTRQELREAWRTREQIEAHLESRESF